MADRNNRQAEVSLWGPDNKQLTSTTGIGKEYLDVLMPGDQTFQLQAFSPVTVYNSTGVSLNSTTWTTLLTQTETGKLDFIACSAGTSNYRVRLTVDGVEAFDVAMSDLNAIGLSNATNVPMWAETALKNFRYYPNQPVDYTTDVLVEAMATTGTATLYYLITHRDAV